MSKFFFPLFLVFAGAVWVAVQMSGKLDEAEQEQVAAETKQDDFRPEAPGPRAAAIKKRADNHFWADAKINNVRVEFMVDTGATSVALTMLDAKRLGYDDDDLDFKYKVNTAGGETVGAFILLDEVQIGRVKVKDVGALVIRSNLKQSLLGMSFLGELSSYEVRKTTMIIRE